MNTHLYLQSLGLKNQQPSLTFLNEIISAHQRTISFNNLAVFFKPGQILNLEIEHLFEKVIVRREGGYCYENNKVFYYLLQGLGFNVKFKAARVMYNQTGDRPRTHRMTIVDLDNKRFLVDVGFGRNAPSEAVELNTKSDNSHYVIKTDNLYHLYSSLDGERVELYTFDDCHYQESDFNLANYYTNTHPDSNFVKSLMVVRKDGDLTELISNRVYSRIESDERVDIAINNQEEFQYYLKNFGVEKRYDFSLLLETEAKNR